MAMKASLRVLAAILLWMVAMMIIMQGRVYVNFQLKFSSEGLSHAAISGLLPRSDQPAIDLMHDFAVSNSTWATIASNRERGPLQSHHGTKAEHEEPASQSPTSARDENWRSETETIRLLPTAKRSQQTTPTLETAHVVRVGHKVNFKGGASTHTYPPIAPGVPLVSFDNPPQNLSYVLALSFMEQLSAATQNFLQLAPLAVDWKAHLVEPVVINSQLFGIGSVYPKEMLTPLNNISPSTQHGITLSQIYDLDKINAILHSHVSHNVGVETFADFISTAPKGVTVMHFNRVHSAVNEFTLNQSEARAVEYIHTLKKDIIVCSNLQTARMWTRMIESRLNAALPNSNTERFRVREVLCLNPDKVFDSQELLMEVSLPATVVFTSWQGCALVNCSAKFKTNTNQTTNPSSFRASAVLTQAAFRHPVRVMSFHKLHNPSIRKTAEKYLEHIGIQPPFLAIHIRSERLLKDGAKLMNNSSYYKCCLQLVKELVSGIQESTVYQQTLVISDTNSPYGTSGCNRISKYCSESAVNLFASTLRSLNFIVTSYDPKALNTTENSGFVSLVEMHMLSMGERLILVGRGGFEAILEDLFLQTGTGHKRSHVHRVCMANKPRVNDVCVQHV